MAAGSIALAVEKAKMIGSILLEVEVESMDELAQALEAKPTRIMLDNFSLDALRTAVELVDGRVELEASGNITLETIRGVAETGVDYISIGALTKSVQAVDLSMRIDLEVGS